MHNPYQLNYRWLVKIWWQTETTNMSSNHHTPAPVQAVHEQNGSVISSTNVLKQELRKYFRSRRSFLGSKSRRSPKNRTGSAFYSSSYNDSAKQIRRAVCGPLTNLPYCENLRSPMLPLSPDSTWICPISPNTFPTPSINASIKLITLPV